jgi:DNA-3-methyladenine glycosylase II
MNSFSIQTPPEFSFEHCLVFLKRSPLELLHVCSEDNVIKLLPINSKRVLFSLKKEAETTLKVTVLNEQKANSDLKEYLERYVREWFDLDTDLKPFYKLAAKDTLLKNLVKEFHGYRIIGQPDLFESLIWAVLGQQINLNFAYTLKQRFVEGFGERIMFEGKSYFTFPQASGVATISTDQLLPLQFSRQKSNYVVHIAEAFASGQISKEKLKDIPFQEAKEILMKIKGIGNWTANYALMKTFRHPQSFPLEDAGLHNAIKKALMLDRKPTLSEVKEIFKKYKGWEAYATLYLWKSL